eukprot:TRINITY_DN8931_c0_g1_i1.p1 TRINITY_DN8931_c0_g1~~TRINITY_DN8931_c0_g1_i1.p1  ORF type:complete len:336 (-),score=129.05 TRINITY_DN8931_c0_g1_i1:139-1146(-)
MQDSNSKVFAEKSMIEKGLIEQRHGQLAAQKEATSLVSMNEQLASERAVVGSFLRDVASEVFTLKRAIDVTSSHLQSLQKSNRQKEEEQQMAAQNLRERREHVEKLVIINNQSTKDNMTMTKRIEELRERIRSAKREYDSGVILLDTREKELTRVKAGLSCPRVSGLEASGELRKLRHENTNLLKLLDQYTKDIHLQKKLHEIEVLKKQDIEVEKKKLENEALTKHIEAMSARKKLEEVRDVNEQLAEDKEQLGQELSALKQHAEVLHTQNLQLHSELEKLADTDTQIRQSLDRRERVKRLQNKNYQQLRHSLERVRNSLSPPKKTMYNGSPGKG